MRYTLYYLLYGDTIADKYTVRYVGGSNDLRFALSEHYALRVEETREWIKSLLPYRPHVVLCALIDGSREAKRVHTALCDLWRKRGADLLNKREEEGQTVLRPSTYTERKRLQNQFLRRLEQTARRNSESLEK